MKLQGNVIVQNHLKGSISEEELLAFIRQTVAIPAGANVTFRFLEPDDIIAGGGRLTFDAIWSDQQRGEEQELPAKVMTTVPPPAGIQHEPG